MLSIRIEQDRILLVVIIVRLLLFMCYMLHVTAHYIVMFLRRADKLFQSVRKRFAECLVTVLSCFMRDLTAHPDNFGNSINT